MSSLPTEVLGRELRILLESLGAVFIKLGQLLSYHPFPGEVRQELQKLMYQVTPFDTKIAEKIVREETGEELKLERMSTASMSQVHVDEFGRIVKVMKPNLREEVLADLSLLRKLESFVPDKMLRETIRMLNRSLLEEIDFRNEARNADEMRFLNVKIPEIYAASENVIVMERLDGVSLVNLKSFGLEERKRIFAKILEVVEDSVYAGIVHGDPSPANVIVGDEIGLVDFGLVWKAGARERKVIRELYDSILLMDWSAVQEIVNSEILRRGEVEIKRYPRSVAEALFSENNIIESTIYGSQNVSVKSEYLVFIRSIFQWLKLCRDLIGPKERLMVLTR